MRDQTSHSRQSDLDLHRLQVIESQVRSRQDREFNTLPILYHTLQTFDAPRRKKKKNQTLEHILRKEVNTCNTFPVMFSTLIMTNLCFELHLIRFLNDSNLDPRN